MYCIEASSEEGYSEKSGEDGNGNIENGSQQAGGDVDEGTKAKEPKMAQFGMIVLLPADSFYAGLRGGFNSNSSYVKGNERDLLGSSGKSTMVGAEIPTGTPGFESVQGHWKTIMANINKLIKDCPNNKGSVKGILKDGGIRLTYDLFVVSG